MSMKFAALCGVSVLALAAPTFAAAAAGAAAIAASAQPPAPAGVLPPTSPAVASDTTVGEIVVTSERRSTSVRQVGFSEYAVSGETLRAQEIHNPSNLVSLVPGITLNSSDKSLTVVEIRGSVSTFRTATLDAPIGFFVDDVYYPYSTDLNLNFFDLQRAEVLRGPQGTLFGRNVTGGAIVVTTNNPTFDKDWLAQITGGNFGYFRSEGMLNGELIPGKLAGRLAFSTERSNGMIDRPNLNSKGERGDTASVRGKLLFTPRPDLSVLLTADYSTYEGDGTSTALVAANKAGTAPNIPAYFATQGKYSLDDWTNSTTYYEPNGITQQGLSAHVDWKVLGGTATSISSYRKTSGQSYLNTVAFPGPAAFPYDAHVDNTWFTQEVRFASAPGRFTYVVGAFFLDGDYHTENILTHRPPPGSALFCSYNFSTATNGCPAVGSSTTNPTGYFTADRNQRGSVQSIAAFGEATFHFTDQLSLTAGGRETSDRKHVDTTVTSPNLDPFGYTQPQVAGYPGPVRGVTSKTWSAFTPRVILKYVPNGSINTYLTYSEGFKSGGYVDNSYSTRGLTLPLEPEHATNYEGGIKTRLFDGRLAANVAVFREETKNLQNYSGAGGIPHTYNGSSRVQGVEFESTTRLTPDFTVTLNYAYLDAIYTDLRDPATVTLANPAGTNYAGNPLKYTPKNSLSVGAEYVFHLANGARLTAQGDYQYSDPYSTQDSAQNLLYPKIYDGTRGNNLNARLNYATSDGRYSVQLWVKNLLNYYKYDYADDDTSFTSAAPGSTFWRVVGNNPRTFGVTLTARR